MSVQTTLSTIPFETETGNKYIFDRQLKKNILCPPLLHHMARLQFAGTDPGEWVDRQLNQLNHQHITIDDVGTFSPEDLKYYYKKYLLLKENGFFGHVPQEKILDTQVTAEAVERSLANLRQLTLEITDACNLQCEYCGYGKFYCDYDKRENNFMDFSMAKHLIDNIVKLLNSPLNLSHDGNTFISFYGGEPLLNFTFIKDTVNYVKTIKATNRHFSFAMTTNALLLEKHMDFLVENDFNLLISLDGNEANNEYRVLKNGKPAYNEILRNIEALRKKYPDYFERKAYFNAVLHNKNSVEEVYKFFKTQFNKTPGIASLNSGGVRKDREEEFWRTYANPTESLFNSEDYSRIEKDMFIRLPNIQAVSSFIHYGNDFCFSDYNELLYGKPDRERLPTGTCFPFSKKVFVTVNGKVLVCERIGQGFEVARVTSDGSGFPPDYQKIADTYNAMFDKIRKKCNACYNLDQCAQCIYFLDLSKENPGCNAFLNVSEYSQQLAAYYDYIEGNGSVYEKILKEVLLD